MPFQIALSGLNAASADLNVTANNIANVNTTGFKSSRAEFADMFPISAYGVSSTATGIGVRTGRVAQQMTQGNINTTGNTLDMAVRSEEHTSELQSLMRISYAVFCLKKKKKQKQNTSNKQ